MKTSSIIWTVVVIVVLVGAGVWIWEAHSPTTAYAPSQTTSTSQAATTTPTTTTSGTQQTAAAATTTTKDQTTTAPTPSKTSNGPFVVDLSTNVTHGTYLVATNGMTLYTSTNDRKNVSNCNGECAVVWPPYTVSSAAQLNVAGTIAGQIGTITRPGGILQVTYNGMPLYFYEKDSKVGDTNGENVGGFVIVNP